LKAANLANGNPTAKRRELDFYPTPANVAHALMQFLQLPPCEIWEPACGEGAMSSVLSEYGHRVTATDLNENANGFGGVDFLSEAAGMFCPIDCHAVITNPPFNVADKFITKSLTIAPVVAMLLKSQYWHASKRLPLFRDRPPAYVLPLTWRPDFMNGERGGSPTMDVAWSVWVAGDTQTRYVPLARPA